MQTLLLMGFEPFDQDPVNPSWEAVRQLDGMLLGEGVQIVARRLPCAFALVEECLAEWITQLRPAMVIATGLGPGRDSISMERVAINVNDARIPDNLGAQPVDTPVVVDGPAAYFSTLPIKAMVKALREAGVPAAVSQTAGTFVCNQVFYLLQHALAGTGVRSGFIHVPKLPEQVVGTGLASMPLVTTIEGLRLAVQVAWSAQVDVVQAGGQVS